MIVKKGQITPLPFFALAGNRHDKVWFWSVRRSQEHSEDAALGIMLQKQSPLLSVVIATTQPWPEVRPCLDSLRTQVQSAGAEIILADSNGRGLPEDFVKFYPDVKWLKLPQRSIFYLRSVAMSQAKGEIIAVTEDHCRVKPDWCEQVMAGHKTYPEAAAIGGAVENGATEYLMDWANFFIGNGAVMPPLSSGEGNQITLAANISFKRRAIPRTIPETGVAEMFLTQVLHKRGEKLVTSEGIVVVHVQSLGFFGTCIHHFHNGRSIAGLRLPHMSGLEWAVRLGGCLLLPPWLLWLTVSAVGKKRRLLGRLITSLPAITLLSCCHAVGEFIGYLAGPGSSPRHLR